MVVGVDGLPAVVALPVVVGCVGPTLLTRPFLGRFVAGSVGVGVGSNALWNELAGIEVKRYPSRSDLEAGDAFASPDGSGMDTRGVVGDPNPCGQAGVGSFLSRRVVGEFGVDLVVGSLGLEFRNSPFPYRFVNLRRLE